MNETPTQTLINICSHVLYMTVGETSRLAIYPCENDGEIAETLVPCDTKGTRL